MCRESRKKTVLVLTRVFCLGIRNINGNTFNTSLLIVEIRSLYRSHPGKCFPHPSCLVIDLQRVIYFRNNPYRLMCVVCVCGALAYIYLYGIIVSIFCYIKICIIFTNADDPCPSDRDHMNKLESIIILCPSPPCLLQFLWRSIYQTRSITVN